uniref:Transposable element Tc3 transposase n=1 Tax=Bactrocera dorsalis TaxID=27457 RepID=A0A034WKC7_BACDO
MWFFVWGNYQPVFFFRNEAGDTVTVNGAMPLSMFTNFLWLQLEEVDHDNIWFQQNLTTVHKARATTVLLRENFIDSIISRSYDIEYPPRSCDSTPFDYCLRSYLKSLVFGDKPNSL